MSSVLEWLRFRKWYDILTDTISKLLMGEETEWVNCGENGQIWVSSAQRWYWKLLKIDNQVQIEHRRGQRKEPWGTPTKGGRGEEESIFADPNEFVSIYCMCLQFSL